MTRKYAHKLVPLQYAGAPTANFDGHDTAGVGRKFNIGDEVLDTSVSPNEMYECKNNTAGAAVWDYVDDAKELAGVTVSTISPEDGYVLTYVASANEWQPALCEGIAGTVKAIKFVVNSAGSYTTNKQFYDGNILIEFKVSVTSEFNSEATISAIVDSSSQVTIVSAGSIDLTTIGEKIVYINRKLVGATEEGSIKVLVSSYISGEANIEIDYANANLDAVTDPAIFVPKVFWSGIEDFTSLSKYTQIPVDGTIELNSGNYIQITTADSASEPPDLPRIYFELKPSNDFLIIGHVGPNNLSEGFNNGQHIYFGYSDITSDVNNKFWSCTTNLLKWSEDPPYVADDRIFCYVGEPPIYMANPCGPTWWMLKRIGTTLYGGFISGAIGPAPEEGDFTAMGSFEGVPLLGQGFIFGGGNNWSRTSECKSILDYLSVAYL